MSYLRLGLAVAGFTLAVLGVAADDIRLVWAAIALLLGSLLVRLILSKRVKGRSHDLEG